MATNFLYSDIDRAMSIDSRGNIKILYDVDVIIQSIKILIGTFTGEMPRSLVGSRMLALLGRNINNNTAEDIRDELISIITKYEPRVEIINIFVNVLPDLNQYEVELRLRLRATERVFGFNTRLRTISLG